MRYIFLEWVNDFEIMMLDALAKDHPVLKINRIMRRYKSINKLLPGASLKKWHKRLHCAIKLSKIKKDDIVVCNGYSVFPFLDYVATLPCKKILILRDSVEALTDKRRNLGQLGPQQDYIETVRPIFDVIMTFDPADKARYQLKSIEQFLPFSWRDIECKRHSSESMVNRCFFVGGYIPSRTDIINMLTPELARYGYDTDFYLLDKYNNQDHYPANCKNEKLSYKENIEKVIQANILLEINKPEQHGLTLRALEALAFNKKLITNNHSIDKMAFYHPSRIFILGKDNLNDLGAFLHTPIVPAENDIIKRFCADAMLENLKKSLHSQ